MIKFTNLNQETPYLNFKKKYDDAFNANQKNIEAISISSYSKKLKEVNARFVNLKFIADKNFIFFSNYNSPKSYDFKEHNQITALVYWNSTNTQIRMKATIERSPKEFNESYFSKRAEQKNALSISSNQSEFIDSYESVKEKYLKSLEHDDLKKCPDFWGGYSFTPYYFEFWEGHSSRLNKRDVYEKSDDSWKHFILQP
jgi:pyridoxamine 5'-phosphate oxidase